MDLILFILGMLVLGCGVGVISAALGVGGGILMVPAFTTFLPGMDINTAKGSSLLIIAFVSAHNSWRMNRGAMKTPWDVIGTIALGSMIGGYIGALVTTRMSETAVTWIFVSLLGFAALRTFFLETPKVAEGAVRRRRAMATGIGGAAGFVGGATGTGGGAILVPFALWSGICSNERVVAMSNTVMVATATASAIGHLFGEKLSELPWTYGQVNIAVAPFVFAGALVASPLGERINAALSLQRRKYVMGGLLLVIALRLVFRTLGE